MAYGHLGCKNRDAMTYAKGMVANERKRMNGVARKLVPW